MALARWMTPPAQLGLYAVCAVGFDLGVQVTLISHQAIVYSIDPQARSRLNAVLFIGMFTGMATGAALGSQLLASTGWTAVIAMSTLFAIAALAVRWWPQGPSAGE